MSKQRIGLLGLAVTVGLSCCSSATAETWRLKNGDQWESVASDPQERYLHAISQLKELAQSGDKSEVKEALKQIREEFPDRVGPDLDLFIYGEMYYWRDRYGKSLTNFEKMFK